MKAIAQIKRVFKDKHRKLVIDHFSLADHLKRALSDYTDTGSRGEEAVHQQEAVVVIMKKDEFVVCMYHGHDYALLLKDTDGDSDSHISQ